MAQTIHVAMRYQFRKEYFADDAQIIVVDSEEDYSRI